MDDIAIRVEGLGKRYRIGQYVGYKTLREMLFIASHTPTRVLGGAVRRWREGDRHSVALQELGSGDYIWALKDVSFEVKQGEAIGIIGRNGSGKSTLLKILSRITAPTEGQVEIRGRVGSLLEVGTGFHPELTGRENIYLNGAVLGMKKAEVDRKFDEIVSFAEIEKFLDTPVKRYSSGMYVRLAFAVAAHLEPEILIVDEVLAVGDTTFQKKCLGKMGSVAGQGRTVLFVSHNMAAVLNLCSKAILLDGGGIRCAGSVQHVVDSYIGEAIGSSGEVVFPRDRLYMSNDLRFAAVRILGSDGNPTGHVDLLKGFTLEIEYEVSRPVRHGQIAFELFNSAGVCVACSTDFDEHPDVAEEPSLPGYYRASCFIPPTYLRAGSYWIDLGSSIPNVRMLDELRSAIAFDVVDSGSAESKLQQGRRGVIAPILHWETKRTV